jgi:hypothetical protein
VTTVVRLADVADTGEHLPFLRTEDVAPVDVDGVQVVAVGSLGWLGALVFVLVDHRDLVASGRQWWITTALLGLALALPGMGYCLRRRSRLRSGRPADPTEGMLTRRKDDPS